MGTAAMAAMAESAGAAYAAAMAEMAEPAGAGALFGVGAGLGLPMTDDPGVKKGYGGASDGARFGVASVGTT